MSEDHFSGSPGKHCLTEKCLTVFDFRISQDFPENKKSRFGNTGVPEGDTVQTRRKCNGFSRFFVKKPSHSEGVCMPADPAPG
jgi:hypothetical protein